MCSFTNDISELIRTDIFTSLNDRKDRQIIIYSNIVKNYKENNLLILPVPNIETIEIIDMENYKEFFRDCYDCFRNNYDGGEYNNTKYSNQKYDLFIVKCINSLNFIDDDCFTIPEKLKNSIIDKYREQKDIGFLFLKLKCGEFDYLPIGYSHKIRYDNSLFIPYSSYKENIIRYRGNNRVYIINDTIKEDDKQYKWNMLRFHSFFIDNKSDYIFDRCNGFIKNAFRFRMFIDRDKLDVDLPELIEIFKLYIID